MTITPQQREELLEAAKPLIRWLNENTHPHCKVLVDTAGLELVEGVSSARTFEFIKD
jgi:hypothetical protein